MDNTQQKRLKHLRSIPVVDLDAHDFWEEQHLIMLEVQDFLKKHKEGKP